MPGNLIQAAPTEVMPAHLSKAFHEEMNLQCDLNQYPDGSSDRNPLALNTRRYWTMQQVLLPDEWAAMRTFYFAHQGKPFFFYNPRETVPPFSWYSDGSNPVGRYIVVFDGNWTETYGHERGQMTGVPPTRTFKGYGATVSLALREVA